MKTFPDHSVKKSKMSYYNIFNYKTQATKCKSEISYYSYNLVHTALYDIFDELYSLNF